MRYLRLLALVIIIAACKGGRTLPSPSAETPVFIISVDTLRSDRLPAYGYDKIKTPHIDALRADSILYDRAYSHYPLTLPAHASILTGRLPADHGVRDNTGYQFGKNIKSVTEILRGHGYTTGAAVSSFVLRRETGIDRGFEFYDDAVAPLSREQRQISTIQRDGAETARVAGEWIGKQQKPVFFLLHIYEPHTPYKPPEPYRSLYSDPYDGEVARSDEIVGQFIALLKERELYDKSLVILLSDHGEGLNDHGEQEHGMFLYREAIQVPLMVKLPNSVFAGKSVAAPVQLIDVVPTILERTGAPPLQLPGRSLTSFLTGDAGEQRKIYSETYYPRLHFGWSEQHSLIDGDRHYIHSTRSELFDLAKDPGEKTNILEQERRTYFAMRAAITPLIREAAAPAVADPEEVAKLAALGYLGSTVQTKPGEVLPDPKDQIGEVRHFDTAFGHFHQKRYQEALTTIDALLARNPRILDLWDLKSKALARLGRLEEAVAASKEGLKLSPHVTHLALDVARLQIELRNFDDAEKHAELAITGNPADAHELLARIWIERKNLPRAEAEARKAMEKAGERIAPLMTMARVQREQGNLDGALGLLNRAVQQKNERDEFPYLYFLRADVLARLGRFEEAEKDFRREIELFPEDSMAYKNLVLLLVTEGRVQEAAHLIRKLVHEAPVPPSYYAICDTLKTVGDTRGVRYWARQGLSRYPNDRVLQRLAS